jgi:sulfide dehydrogenase cytochrome subunit
VPPIRDNPNDPKFPRNRKRLGLLCVIAMLPFALPAANRAGTAMPAALPLVVNCFTCHGSDGASPGSIPSLSGKTRVYLLEKLRGFQTDAEASTVMGRIARGYTDAEVEAIADYLAPPP